MDQILQHYNGKRVLVTGHTGFKGSWLCMMLKMAGAKVTGYAMEPDAEPALFRLAGIEEGMDSWIGDIRDLGKLRRAFWASQPEYVFHLAAQPIVREGYKDPVGTYSTNVMGTVNLLECVRGCGSVKSVVNVTTDKVYLNRETEEGYREGDKLDGHDPYSNSKSCSELATHSYYKSFLREQGVRVSTARAGNVIGGGDFEKDRIVPDCVRAALSGSPVGVRNPSSIRPYQYVLEPLFAYLLLAQKQLEDPSCQGAYNVGPDERDCWDTGRLADCFCKKWGEGMAWRRVGQEGPHEASLLKLDCSKLREAFSWQPRWDVEKAMEKVVEWAKEYRGNGDIQGCMERQIREYMQ